MRLNEDIRKAIRVADLRFWMVAKELGYTDSTFSKKLRFELTEDFKNKILNAIDKLSKEGEKCE